MLAPIQVFEETLSLVLDNGYCMGRSRYQYSGSMVLREQEYHISQIDLQHDIDKNFGLSL